MTEVIFKFTLAQAKFNSRGRGGVQVTKETTKETISFFHFDPILGRDFGRDAQFLANLLRVCDMTLARFKHRQTHGT